MYPSRFAYDAPTSLGEAIAILDASGGEAKILAGGQSLIPMLKLRFASPERIVDINNIPGLDYMRVDPDGTLHIGALAVTVAVAAVHAVLPHNHVPTNRSVLLCHTGHRVTQRRPRAG